MTPPSSACFARADQGTVDGAMEAYVDWAVLLRLLTFKERAPYCVGRWSGFGVALLGRE